MPGDDLDRAAWFLAGDDTAAVDGEREQLARLRRMLNDDALWARPPPELADAIIDDIEAFQPPAERARWPRRALLAGLSMAAAVLVVVGVVTLSSESGGAQTETIALAGTSLAPDAAATAELLDTPSGVAITLDIAELPPARKGFFYEAWVKGPNGSVAVGTFHFRDGQDPEEPIELWSGVDLAEYPTLTITLEPEDGNPASSGQVVLKGEIPTPPPSR